MPTSRVPQWLHGKLPYRATSAASTCISFFLLSISLFSPSWMEDIAPVTHGSSRPAEAACNERVCNQPGKESDFKKAARILLVLATAAGFTAAFSLFVSCRCFGPRGRLSNMLVSSVASFTTGAFGYASMALYTVDDSWKNVSSVGHMHFTWSFCLAWLVFTLYFMNGFFSLVTHSLYPVPSVGWQRNQIFLEGRVEEAAAGDNMAVGSPVLPRQETSTNLAINAFPVPSICVNSTIV